MSILKNTNAYSVRQSTCLFSSCSETSLALQQGGGGCSNAAFLRSHVNSSLAYHLL